MSRKIPSTYHITTFGCQFNVADSERIKGTLNTAGFKEASHADKADVLIFNTCSVRQSAEDRVFGLNKKLRELKENYKKSRRKVGASGLKIILTGCILHYGEKKLKSRLPYIDTFLPIKDLPKLPQMLGAKTTEIPEDYLNFKPEYDSTFRAYVPISSGCNNFCSFCIVPFARGRERSRPANEIIKEARNLVKNGYKEIWLLGQNVNSYGINRRTTLMSTQKYAETNFADLLRIINDIPGDFWLRFTSPHPKDLSDDLIKAMAECEKITEYVNLPVQSGDNEILHRMNRPYTIEHYENLVRKIRKAMPDIVISTDVIVGFPGETKKQFQNTVKLFKKIKFDMAYISEYSPRPGTAAAKAFKDNVPRKEKSERKKILTEILAKTALANNEKLIGKTLNVLIDEKKGSRIFGRTRGNKVVELDCSAMRKPIRLSHSRMIGQFRKVKISKAEPWKLIGTLL